jgi:hypothetical protein
VLNTLWLRVARVVVQVVLVLVALAGLKQQLDLRLLPATRTQSQLAAAVLGVLVPKALTLGERTAAVVYFRLSPQLAAVAAALSQIKTAKSVVLVVVRGAVLRPVAGQAPGQKVRRVVIPLAQTVPVVAGVMVLWAVMPRLPVAALVEPVMPASLPALPLSTLVAVAAGVILAAAGLLVLPWLDSAAAMVQQTAGLEAQAQSIPAAVAAVLGTTALAALVVQAS